MTFLLLLAKIFVFPLVFIFAIGIINMLVVLIAVPFMRVPKFPLIYQIIYTLFSVFMYALWGAYMRSLVLNYSSYLNKWILIALCLASILMSIKYIMKEMENERNKLNEMAALAYENQKEILGQSITVVNLSLSPFILVSFIIFFFAEGLYETVYFRSADAIARLFM